MTLQAKSLMLPCRAVIGTLSLCLRMEEPISSADSRDSTNFLGNYLFFLKWPAQLMMDGSASIIACSSTWQFYAMWYFAILEEDPLNPAMGVFLLPILSTEHKQNHTFPYQPFECSKEEEQLGWRGLLTYRSGGKELLNLLSIVMKIGSHSFIYFCSFSSFFFFFSAKNILFFWPFLFNFNLYWFSLLQLKFF